MWGAGGCRMIEELLGETSIDVIVDERRRRCGKPFQIILHGFHTAPRRMSHLQNLFGAVRARTCGNTDGNEIACLHG
jgi:hypothetical protein